MDKPEFSILIPSFNNANYLENCIQSIIDQSYQNFEIIIVDDCSTDNSQQIMKKLKKKFINKIKCFYNNVNIGTYKTLNKALELSNGIYITKLDPDDKFHMNRLQEDKRYLLNYKIVISNYIRESEYNTKYYHNPNTEIKEKSKYPHSMISFHKDILKKSGNYLNCRFGGDTEFYLRLKCLFPKKDFYFNDKVLYIALNKKNNDQLTKIFTNDRRKLLLYYINILHKFYNEKITKKKNDLMIKICKFIAISNDDHSKNLKILYIGID